MSGRIPPGPAEPVRTGPDLLAWMSEQARRHGDIYMAAIDGVTTYVVSAPDLAEHVLRGNWQNYTKGWAIKRVAMLLGHGLMASEGELWQGQRRMIQPAFHRGVLAALAPPIARANAALRERWEDEARAGRTVNVTRDLSRMVLAVVLEAILGSDHRALLPAFGLLTDEGARDLSFAQSFRRLRQPVRDLVARRRREERGDADILGLLMAARDRDSGLAMPDGRLIDEVMTLIVAGHETTASVLNWAWHLLARHPEAEAKLSRALAADGESAAYLRQVLDETMRLYPPGWLLTRRALGPDRLGDYDVPAGTEIHISPYLIHRNPAVWPEPDRFDPERFDSARAAERHPLAFLPFSAGPRNCIGEGLARLEMQTHLAMLVPHLRLVQADAGPPALDPGVNLRSRGDFLMQPAIK